MREASRKAATRRGPLSRALTKAGVLAALGAVLACSSFDAEVGPVAAADAGAATDAAVEDGRAPEAGGVLLTTGFEGPAAATCGDGWDSWQGQARAVESAHIGTVACRVCPETVDTDVFTLDGPHFDDEVVQGATYEATAWVRRDAPRSLHARLIVRAWPGEASSVTIFESDTPSVILETDEWTRLSTTFVLKDPVPAGWVADAYVQFEETDGDTDNCVIVDDFEVQRRQ